MKSVILFRHGKSDWNANYISDHERPLSKRGIDASKKMGLYLSRTNQIPELILSSTSLRTKSTIKFAIKEGRWLTNIFYDKNIYGGSLSTLIDILKKQDNNIDKICIVGHEPVLSSFIIKSSNSSEWIKFPTGSMAKINFKTQEWKKIQFKLEKSELDWFIKPKSLNQSLSNLPSNSSKDI